MRIFRQLSAILTLLLAYSPVCLAAAHFPASTLRFEYLFGTRPGDSATYFFLGSGWLRALTTGSQEEFVKQWLKAHPDAVATPISERNVALAGRQPPMHWVYIWIEDGEDCLNVDLISSGIFPGGVMIDMVEQEQRISELILDPTLKDMRVQIEKERAETPIKDRPRRLVSDSDYTARMARIEAAESQARNNKRGIWSDRYKSEREMEDLP
jgi:hypothetical protein